MVEGKIKVVNPLGLHARAAAQLVRLSTKFNSRVIIKRTDNQELADAKSILGVLTLAAAKGTEILLIIEGADEKRAFEEIKILFEEGFGEI